ncbi:hypothetical protein GCM10023221_10920 [Luteimicrobium xylanilyticum]|uniref:Uncharacterized protein n=1 Tax=Luteimicrobium xylanilyticum TaxID=1133546 RepID=A0A5P9QEA3_9MICO|nr:hypothetical protein [Luteimicrobium xylanilyticum]QFU99432.1 hypothetical protein KDY119_02963 [Luteimicrobium xylanilyticum]
MGNPNQHDLRAASIEHRHGKVDPAVYRRRRIVVGVAAALLAILVVLFLAYAWPGFARSDGEAKAGATVTVTQPAPSATAKPAALPDGATPFLKALPGTAGPWARTAAKSAGAGAALEAWTVTYAGPYGGAGTTVTVRATQYDTAAHATDAAADAVAKAGDAAATGDVVVGGKKAGTYAVVPGSDGNAQVVWSNGTATFVASGPEDAVRTFYAAFPM